MIEFLMMFSGVGDWLNEICDWVALHWDSFLIGLGSIGISGGTILLISRVFGVLIQKGILNKSTLSAQMLTTRIFKDLDVFKNELIAIVKKELENSKNAILISVNSVLDVTKQVKAEIYRRLSDGTLTLEELNANKELIFNTIKNEITGVVEEVNKSVDNIVGQTTENATELIAEEKQNIEEEVNEVIEEVKNESKKIVVKRTSKGD